jgi:hypothetical protein
VRWHVSCSNAPFGFEKILSPLSVCGETSKLAKNSGNISTVSLLLLWLPQFDFVAVGIIDPGEAPVAFVLALRVDLDAFFR